MKTFNSLLFGPFLPLMFGVILVIAATQSFARDTILRSDGSYVEAPKGYVARFVPKDTPDVLVAIDLVELVKPNSIKPTPAPGPADPNAGCTTDGELGLGGAPCPK